MYQPYELARFTLSEFERGLACLTDEEAQTRMTKADGTQMNAVSWVIAHVARHWLALEAYAKQGQLPGSLEPFAPGPLADPTPPPMSDVLKLLDDAKAAIDWIATADDALLSTTPEESILRGSVGTALMRVALHTWFHIGEINAIRQMLGHSPIGFVGSMAGTLEWHSERMKEQGD